MEATVAGEELVRFYESNKNDKDWTKQINHLENLRKRFIKHYTIVRIDKLSLDDYVVGKKSQNSFCYALENKYKELGDIHGANARKFGIYFGTFGNDNNNKYRIGKAAFGSNLGLAFKTVKQEISALVLSSETLTTAKFKANLISPMMKLKILSIYHPNFYIPIFSDQHLSYYVNELGLLPTKKDHISLQKCLQKYKEEHDTLHGISNIEFARLLYTVIKPPKNQSEPLNKLALAVDLQEITLTELSKVGLSLNNQFGLPKGKFDYSEKEKRNRITGSLGEELVVNFERNRLIKNGQRKLAANVERVSKQDDGLGYDIRSFNAAGEHVFIEVKASKGTIENSFYYISRNEVEVGKRKKNYWIYIVYNIKKKNPGLLRIENPFNSDKFKIDLEPTQYVMSYLSQP